MPLWNVFLRELRIHEEEPSAGVDGDGDAEWFLQFFAGPPGREVEFARLDDDSVVAGDVYNASNLPDIFPIRFIVDTGPDPLALVARGVEADGLDLSDDPTDDLSPGHDPLPGTQAEIDVPRAEFHVGGNVSFAASITTVAAKADPAAGISFRYEAEWLVTFFDPAAFFTDGVPGRTPTPTGFLGITDTVAGRAPTPTGFFASEDTFVENGLLAEDSILTTGGSAAGGGDLLFA